MIEVKVRNNEPIDSALKRLKSRLFIEGTLEEVFRRRTFENSQLKRKRKQRSLHKKSKYL
jgi:small subunit ribosomal protein S21